MSSRQPQPPPAPPATKAAHRASLGILCLFAAAYAWSAATVPTGNRPPCSLVACVQLRLDPNTATRDELLLLPGIGEKIADSIIRYREAAAPARAFRTVEDLDNVPRIGPAMVEKLRDSLYLPDESGLAPASPSP